MSAFGQAGFGSMNRRRQLQAQGQLDPYGQQVRAAKQAPTMTAYAQPNAQATGQAPQQSAAAIKQQRMQQLPMGAYTGVWGNTVYYGQDGKSPPASPDSNHYDASGRLAKLGSGAGWGYTGAMDVNWQRESEIKSLTPSLSEADRLKVMTYSDNDYGNWLKHAHGHAERARAASPGTAQPVPPQSQGTPYSGMRVDAYSLGQNQGGAPNGFQTAGQNSGGQPAIQDPVRYFKERGSNPWNLADPSTQRARENPAEHQAALAAISQLQNSFDPRTMEMTRVKDPRKFVELQRRQLGVDALPQVADLRKQHEEAQRAALMEQSDAFRSGRQATEMETELSRRMQNFDDRQRSYGTGHYDPKTYGTNSAYAYASGIRQEQDDLRKLIADTSRRRTARESTEKMLQEDPRRYFEDRARSLGTDWRDEVVQMAALSNSEAMMDQPLVQQAVRTLNQQLQSEAGYQGPYQDRYFIYNKSPWRK